MRAELCHERDMNRVFERKCPGVRKTAAYEQGPCSRAVFYTESARLRYLIEREHGKFNPTVRSDTCGSPVRCQRPPLRQP